MADRTALLMAWLEEEGARQRRPLLLTSAAKDSSPRGWVQVGICAILATLTVALLACWLVMAWNLADRLIFTEQLRREGFRRAIGAPNQSAWWKNEGGTARRKGDAFGAVLCFELFAIVFGTTIGALFLHAACLLYNKLGGSRNSVPAPAFSRAMSIAFVTALVNAIGGFGLLSALVSFLVMAGLISALLPTTFPKALLVAVCYLLVGFLVVVVLGVVFGGLLFVLTHLR